MGELRWVEPQNRHIDEIYRSYDTGLCNRLFHWELAEIINRLHGNRFKIYLQQTHYPEIDELIELPNTILWKENIEDETDFNYKEFTKNTNKIDNSLITQIINGDIKLDDNQSYYPSFGFYQIEGFHKEGIYEDIDRPLNHIKLKDSLLRNSINNFTKNMIGIHVRRGRGVEIRDTIDNINEKIRDEYLEYREKEGAYSYNQFPYINDDIYYRVIDTIITNNPNQKIYISYDGPPKLLDYWFEKYPNNLVRKQDFEGYLSDNNIKINLVKNQHYFDIVDLFSLANCGYILKVEASTWSEFAIIHGKKSFYTLINDDLDKINEVYLKFLHLNKKYVENMG